jgi:uncharacterized protein YodC (DUF2158 family)
METNFKIGDIAQLKSGGPKMTVTNIPDSDKHIVHTSWFAGSKKESGAFPVEALILLKDDPTK